MEDDSPQDVAVQRVAQKYAAEFNNLFTPKEIVYFKKLFDMYDTDSSRDIGFFELKSMCRHLGVELSDPELKTSMSKVNNGFFDFHSFLTWLAGLGSGEHGVGDAGGDQWGVLKSRIRAQGSAPLSNDQIDSFRRVFDLFDQDGSGTIDRVELFNVFQSMGQRDMTLEYIDDLLHKLGDDGRGVIDFDEFVMLMCTGFSPKAPGEEGAGSLEEQLLTAFHEKDPGDTGFVTTKDLKEIIQEKVLDEMEESEVDQIVAEIAKERGDGFVEYKAWDGLWEACRVNTTSGGQTAAS